jgi:hypothetical protein
MEDGAEGVGLSREERFADRCLEKGESLGEKRVELHGQPIGTRGPPRARLTYSVLQLGDGDVAPVLVNKLCKRRLHPWGWGCKEAGPGGCIGRSQLKAGIRCEVSAVRRSGARGGRNE